MEIRYISDQKGKPFVQSSAVKGFDVEHSLQLAEEKPLVPTKFLKFCRSTEIPMLCEFLKKSQGRNNYSQGENGVLMCDILAESAENTVGCLSRTSRQHLPQEAQSPADSSKRVTLSSF